MGLESISEPDDMDMDDDVQDGVDGPFFDTRKDTWSPSTSPDASIKGGAKSSDFDTEEDLVGPITPGPTSRAKFDVGKGDLAEHFHDEDQEDDDDDDNDWVDPSFPTPIEPSSPTKSKRLLWSRHSRMDQAAAVAVG
jgi:cysteine protease ATG4